MNTHNVFVDKYGKYSMNTQNIGFYGQIWKMILKLSSNTHLIFFSGTVPEVPRETKKEIRKLLILQAF